MVIILVIRASFHSFHNHLGRWNDGGWKYCGMTGMMLEWCFSHLKHIPINPVIPDVWRKIWQFLISSLSFCLISSFVCHSRILNQWKNASNDIGMTDDFWISMTTFPKGGERLPPIIRLSRSLLFVVVTQTLAPRCSHASVVLRLGDIRQVRRLSCLSPSRRPSQTI